MYRDGRRLDCVPTCRGALEAKRAARVASFSTESVAISACAGGIFTAPFRRQAHLRRVDRKYGVPFLWCIVDAPSGPVRPSAAVQSRRGVAQLQPLKVQPGMTLISCSGSVGRMAYARAEHGREWPRRATCSRSQPDPEKIPSGYLYAFLGSEVRRSSCQRRYVRFDHPAPRAQHVADIPVPRLGKKIETTAHELVDEAARLRDEASERLRRPMSSHRGAVTSLAARHKADTRLRRFPAACRRAS